MSHSFMPNFIQQRVFYILQSGSVYFRTKMLILLVLGFSSGLPVALTASTLTAMLTDYGVDIRSIGYFALVAIPYGCRFLWAPIVDSIKIPFLSHELGRRRGWLIVVQALLFLTIFSGGMVNISEKLLLFAVICFFIALFSATQDIIFDALRIEMLKPNEQAAGAAISVFGYRIAMLTSSAGALYLSFYFGWQLVYVTMSLLIIPGMVACLLHREKLSNDGASSAENNTISQCNKFEQWFHASYIKPLNSFFSRNDWVYILLLIIFYKMSDAFLGQITNNFLKVTGFTSIQIANIVKIFGLVATCAGMFAAGAAFKRLGLVKMLYVGLTLQIASNFAYIPIYYAGADEQVLMSAIAVENFCSGFSNVVLVVYISKLCDLKFTATHYAFLSSLASFTRSTLVATSGIFVSELGWVLFFIFSAVLSVPAFFFIKRSGLC